MEEGRSGWRDREGCKGWSEGEELKVLVILQNKCSESFISGVCVCVGKRACYLCVWAYSTPTCVQNINCASSLCVHPDVCVCFFFSTTCGVFAAVSISSPAIRHSFMSISSAECSKLPALPATVISSTPAFGALLHLDAAINIASPLHTHTPHAQRKVEFRRPSLTFPSVGRMITKCLKRVGGLCCVRIFCKFSACHGFL